MIEQKMYFDKVYGGWLGKCLGGAAGAPVEGLKKIIPCENFREMLRPDLPNDDLDLQLLWIQVLKEKGMSFSSKDLAEAWDRHCWYPFNEYGIFLKNYERGIMPPYSGAFNNPVFQEGEGCAIRSEIWAMICPGDAERASGLAAKDGCLDHAGEGVLIEQYYAAVEAEAFAERKIELLLHEKREVLPRESRARKCVEDMFLWYDLYEGNWKRCRQALLRKYGHYDFTNAVVNLGIVILALLCGGEDLEQVINIAFRCGYDTDCTCATAGAIWGIAHGADDIPENLKELVSDRYVVGIDIGYKEGSIKKLAEETCQLGQKLSEDTATTGEECRIEIEYYDRPAIGIGDNCRIGVKIINDSSQNCIEELRVENLPEGWTVEPKSRVVNLQPGETDTVDFIVQTEDALEVLQNTNILQMTFGGKTLKFGIAGASEWTAVGPFIESLDKEDLPGTPNAHGEECNLPTLECMVNNYVELQKEYLNEQNFEKAFSEEETWTVHGYEDLLPLESVFSFRGQGCIYLQQELYSPADREIWFVIGNNDGFKIWINGELKMERDEIRLWTPYNNYQVIPLKKGRNSIVIKLLKRTDTMQFSIGYRKYEGEHFHKKRWITDMACLKRQ